MSGPFHGVPVGMIRTGAPGPAVRVPAGHATVHVGGQNGVGADGALVGPGLAEQMRRALANLADCLAAAGASPADVVGWTILCVAGAPLAEGLCAVDDFLPEGAPPPTVVFVAGLAVPGAMVEIEAVAAVPE